MPEGRLERTRRAYSSRPSFSLDRVSRYVERVTIAAKEETWARGVTANVIEGEHFEPDAHLGGVGE